MPGDSDAEGLPVTAAGALLRRLHDAGVATVFVNSGTDFPPIIEAVAEAEANGLPVPRMVLVPHEHIALGMAHGHHTASGRPQAVILHTNVGLANGAIGAINAATDNIPLLIMSGRTPVLESGRFGARTVPIGWGQEMRDQAALVRGATKWEYELRYPEQVPAVVDRALAISGSTPKGPTYLSLPREPLAEACPPEALAAPSAAEPVEVVPDHASLARVAALLAGARRPLVFAQHGAGTEEGFDALAEIADTWAIPVCQYWAVATAISAEHPMYVGQDPAPWIEEADVILVIDALAPWNPNIHTPAPGCTVVHLGPDPLQSRFPMRTFPADVTVRGETGPSLVGLAGVMATLEPDSALVFERRAIAAEHNAERLAALDARVAGGSGSPITKEFAARCIGDAIRGTRSTVLSELGCPLDPLRLTRHGAWRQEPHSGGLGWSFAGGMGMALADPDLLVVATMGDGSYLFGNPVACHQVAESLGIAMLTVVLNDSGYGAVRDSVIGMYPDGYAAKAETMPLVDVPVGGRLSSVAAACGAHAETVEDGSDLPAAIGRALDVVAGERRQAFLEVMIGE